MNNLESAEKKRKRLLEIIAVIIVLCIFLALVFATDLGEGDGVSQDEIATTSVDTNDETEEIETKGKKEIATVAPGGNFTVALDSEGKVWAWGQNNKGQLGNGTLNDSASKQPVLLEETDKDGNHIQLSDVKQVAAGLYHAVALKNNGEVYMWGYNYYGQAGSETVRTELYPRKIAMPNGVKIKQVECSETYTLLLTTEGKILGIGNSNEGQLGYYNGLGFTSIREIEEGKSEKVLPVIEKISAGAYHGMALDTAGEVWIWGYEDDGSFEFAEINQVYFEGLEDGEKIQEIETGYDGISMALSTNGKVYAWDDLYTPEEVYLDDVQVRTDKEKDNIAIISRTYYIISTDNKVYSWGRNNYGQAGIGETGGTLDVPEEVVIDNSVKNKEIDKVSSSSGRGKNENDAGSWFDTAYAINADGYVLGWGYAGTDIVDPDYTPGSNTFKLLGDGTRNYANYIGSISLKNVVGDDIVLDITAEGMKNGKDKENLLKILDNGGYIAGGRVNLYNSSISENSKESLTIKVIDDTIAKYDNDTGMVIGLSQGKTSIEVASSKNAIYLNVEVIGDNVAFAKIESKDNFTVALKADGTVWAWGYNANLGIVDSEHSNYNGIVVPTQIKGLENVKDIAVGANFILVLKTDGTVWAWGYNNEGQLGNGTTNTLSYTSILTTEPELTQVQRYEADSDEEYKLENIIAISAGEKYALALDNNGKVWSWGYNGFRQLGIGNTTSIETRAKEVDLTNLTNAEETIKQIEAGKYTSYILTTAGNVYAFGYNGNNQCGTSGNYYIPTKVTSLNRITKISTSMAGNGSSFALAVNGKVYGFGYNYGLPRDLGLDKVVDISGSYGNCSAIVKFADGTIGYWTGNSVNNSTITKLKVEDGTNINKVILISSGSNFYTVVKTDGTVWTSGSNSNYGQLGNRTTASVALPTLKCISYPYMALSENEVTLKVGEKAEVNATYNYGFNLLKTEEEIEVTYASSNEEIATVIGETITAVSSGETYVTAKNEELGVTLRVKVNVLAENEVTMPNISVGYAHTVAVKTDGTVWGWGINSYGELGDTSTNSVKSPEKIYADEKIKYVAAGTYETLMVTADGKVLAMGYNNYYLGDNAHTSSRVPVTVKTQVIDKDGNVSYVDLENIVKVATIEHRNLALDNNGILYAWGYGANGYAKKVNTFGLKVKDISERLILTEDGRVWEYEYFDRITFKDGIKDIVQISSSAHVYSSSLYGFYMALDAKGDVYTWVRSTSYNRVSGTETTIPTKVVVANEFEEELKVVDIEAGYKVAYAKDEDGNVYSWGTSASTGTLGLGTSTTLTAVPTKINSLADIEVMSASKRNGYNRTFVSNTMGIVYGFGYNSSNSLLGNYDTTGYYYEPVQVGDSYLGFIDEAGNEITRISIEKGKQTTVETSFIDSFNIRNKNSNSDEANCTWRVINADLLSILGGNGKVNTIKANNILGEAVLIAEEIDEDGNKTGVYAKLYVDVIEPGTLVAPKMESVGNHTIALKADGTVWGWGAGINYRNTGTLTEPTQIRIAKQVSVSAPIAKVNEDGTPAVDENGRKIYVYIENGKEKECYQVGDNYTDLSGNFVIRKDPTDNRLYAWDSSENSFALEDLLDNNGEKIVVVDIATSNNHTLLLTNTGDVYSFGYNYDGQLGYNQTNSTNYFTYLPTKVNGLRDIVKIAVGDNFSLALDKHGKLWTFGYQRFYKSNRYYVSANSTVPTQLSKLGTYDISESLKNTIDITNEYMLTKDGEVLNLGTYNKRLNPGDKVPGITGSVIKVTRTSNSGNGHTAFLTEDGEVFTIGAGTYGQLGNDGYANSMNSAVQVLSGEGNSKLTNIRDINVGETHTMAIDKNGKLYTWGHNNNGQLRNSTVEAGVNTARAFEVKTDEKIEEAILVSGGNGFTVVADSTGYAFAWGNGTVGQLGNRLTITSYDAVRVGTEGASLSANHITLQEKGESANITGVTNLLNLIYEQSIDVEEVETNDSNIALTSADRDTDVITINPIKTGTTSIIVKTKTETETVFENIIQVRVLPAIAELADDVKLPANKIIEPMTVSGKAHTLILKSDGTVWAYGDNTYGQTGAKDENGRIIKYSDKVTQVKFPEGTASIIRIAAGDAFSVALDAEGNVWTWGYNANGRLGIGTTDSRVHLEPTKVLSNIIKVEAGSSEVIALNKNGYVYTWGKNNGGNLGIIGTNTDQYSPVRVNNIAGVIDVAAGEYHSMILTSDGTVYTTGRNTSGQLGRNVQKSEYFEKVEIGARIAYIEADNRASVAIDTNGKLWVWGENANGQLGLGIENNKVSEPTQVTTLTERVESASIGENHIHVVTTSGKLYVAGSNNNGQLGIGESVQNSNTFRQVTSLGNNVMKSDAGTSYSTAITKAGKVYGFGDYNLGKTNFTDGYEPVMITNETLYLDEQEIVVNIDGTKKINANGQYKLNVLHKDNSEIAYSSANEEIATVDETGVVTGVAIGTTTIYVKDENENGKTSAVLVKVIPTDATQAPIIEGGDKFTIVTNKNGESYVFGNKDNIAKTDFPSIANNSLSFNSIKAGKDFVVVINKDKTVWVWGDNSKGQLGIEDVESTEKMTVLNTNNINNIVQIDAGDSHTIALDELGIVYVWGDNSQGQLGISATEQPIVKQPTVIKPVGDRIISVSAGGNYSAIVDTTGTAYIIQNGVARPITGIEGAIKVATGTEHTIVLTNKGVVYRVTNSNPIVKTYLTGINSIVDISANNDTFMFLASDKTLYTYGSNENGKLGLGKNGSVGAIKNKVPVEDVFTIGAGYNNTYYINTQGEVFAAGLNTSGELGNGTSTNKDSITFTSSNKYVRVGSQEFELTPKSVRLAKDWKVLVGAKELKEIAVEAEKTKVSVISDKAKFNVFGNEIIDLDKYDFAIADETIAKISDASIVEITAKKLGKTVLIVTNKITKEEKELAINVLTEDMLRIENMYINDTLQDFIAEPDSSEDNKFTVNVEGSEPTGTLNIELEFNDTIQVEDEEGNVLTATYNSDTRSYKITGLDLTKSVQELKITLTSVDGETYEFTLLIFNELIVKVNDVMLSAQNILNKETLVTEKVFTKYVDPKDTEAKVEISIDNIENKIQLETVDGTYQKTTNPAEVLEIADLSIPDIENKFIVKIINAKEKVEKQYVLRITKSSIEAIKVEDLGEVVTADRTVSENEEYLEEFTAKINDTNEFADITIKLGNKDIATIEIDGVDKTDAINNSKLVISKELEKDEEKPTDVVVKITTNEGYVEEYIIKISTISSNNNIDYIDLIMIGTEDVDPIVRSRKVSDDTYEIVLYDADVDLDDRTVSMKLLLESKKATISFNNGDAYLNKNIINVYPKKVTDNQYEIPMIVKAENGDTKNYTLYIYKESENTEITAIKVTGTPSNYENNAIREEGTNNYVGKIIKSDDTYKLAIDLMDEHSVIEEVTINGEVLEGLTGENGKYTIDIDSDILGETIEIKVKAEYEEIEDTYTLTLKELDSNAEFDSVKVDETLFNDLEEINTIEAQVKSEDAGMLTVKAVSSYATVKVYETNPETDATANAIAEGVAEVNLVIPSVEDRTKTLYLEVTSEDGQNKTIKTLVVTKLSNNTNVTHVILNENEATKDNENTYSISVSEATEEGTIVITAEDPNATVKIDEESSKEELEYTTDISNVNEIKFTVISEDGTEKDYTLKINKLSTDTSFTKELQAQDGTVVAGDSDFVKADEKVYTVEIFDTLGDVKLVIKPNNSNATVVIKDSEGNVIENGVIPSDVTQGVKAEITAEDGSTKEEYTIVVISKHHILEYAYVDTEDATTELSEEDILALYKEVRVHPASTTADIYVKANIAYKLSDVTAHVIYKDKDGNPLYDEVKQEYITADITAPGTNARARTVEVDLSENDGKVNATVQITMTITTGETEILTIDIVKGSAKAQLDYVELVGVTSKDTTKQDYTKTYTSEMLIDSVDNKFSLEAVAKENGTVKIYKLAEETENWETVDLSSMTEVTNKSQITLTENDSIYVIEVTSEFGGNKARYKLIARKQHSDATLKDLTVKLGNAISEDENDDIIKKLNDLGKFTYNEETDTYELTAWVPENIDNLSVYDLVADSNAKVEWTDITLGTKGNEYTEYGEENNEKTLAITPLTEIIEKNICIRVTSENGKVQNYCVTFKTIDSNMSLGEFNVYNVTENKAESVENKVAKILQAVKDIRVTGNVNNGAVSLKVLSVNGHKINETIETEFAIETNELSISLDRDYTYVDEDGNIQTISKEAIRTIVVEREAKSLGSYLYPNYYDEEVRKDTLKITRLMTDTSITMKYLKGETEETITSADFDEAGEITIYLPSTQTEVVINEIKADNEFVTVKHGQEEGNAIYINTPYEYNIKEDKASSTEVIKVLTEDGNVTQYKVNFVKLSANNNINSITVNNYKAEKKENSDEYTHTILASANRINVGVTGVEKDATVKVYVSAINDEAVTVEHIEATYLEPSNGVKVASKDIYSQLNKPLNEINKITVKIEVQAEDENVSVKEYTLNISVEESNLISINGINTDGIVSNKSQLVPADFVNGGNPYSTDVIKVSADVNTVELTNIKYTDEEHAVLTDADGNVLKNKSLTVNVDDNAITEAKIVITLNENRQEFVIRIQKKSTDTSIKEVIADKDKTNTVDTETGSYVLSIRSTINPDVQIVLNNKLAKVISATVENLSNAEVSDIEDNKFTISKVAIDKHQDIDEEEPIIVKVKVQPEDEGTEPQEHTIRLVRKHTETGLVEVKYEYDKNAEVITNTLDYAYADNQEVQIISANVEGIRIAEILPECSKAKAYVQLEDGTKEELDPTKLYEIAEGAERTFTIIVEAEYGNEKAYTFKVRKLVANTKLDKITVNGVDAIYNEEEGIYTANIRVDKTYADIVVKPNDVNTKVKEVLEAKLLDSNTSIPSEIGEDEDSISNIEVNGNKISIIEVIKYVDDATEDGSENANRYIVVKFVVEAEDTDVTEEYTIKITRQHIETSVEDITYNYTKVVTLENETTSEYVTDTLTLSEKTTERIVVESTVETINIAKITPVCNNNNVTVEISVDGKVVPQGENGFNIDLSEEIVGDGCIKPVEVTVTAECGDSATYRFEVVRTAKNASLTKVIVNKKEATRLEETEEGIEAVYRVSLGKTTQNAYIEAISSNVYAQVEIETGAHLTNIVNGQGKATATYKMSEVAEDGTMEVLIEVTPQDTNIEAKTYKLIIERMADRTILDQFRIEQVVAEDEVADEPITISDNSEIEADYYFTKESKNYPYTYTATRSVSQKALLGHTHADCIYNGQVVQIAETVTGYAPKYWYQTEKIEIPTNWYNVSFKDILPSTPNMTVTIQRISGPNPHDASIYNETYSIDTPFKMIEGQDVYFKVVTTAESGDRNLSTFNNSKVEVPYVIHLYKKATSTDVKLVIDNVEIKPDEAGIYKVTTNVDKESMKISAVATNNLAVKETIIETESDVRIDKVTTGALSKNVIFDLTEMNKLDKIDERVITLTLKVQPEDKNIEPKEYVIEITRQDTSVAIKQVIGQNGEEVVEAVLDTQMSHYNYVDKAQVDNTIYTLYINEDVTQITTDIIAESVNASIYLNEDYENVAGVGKVENINVEISETGITEVKVRVVSEDGKNYQDYRIWYIKKSNDASIKELYVDGEAFPANEETGNYEITISDTVTSIDVKMIPNYEFANVSINGQPYKWQEAEEIINKYTLKGESVEIKLQVNIPAEQSTTGVAINNTKYLYINRVSTSNRIVEITTDNYKDFITPVQWNEATGAYDTYKINLDGNREFIDLRIVPESLGATLTIYDEAGEQLVDSEIGTLYLENILVNDEDIVTFKVNVAPEEGVAKDYYINIVPKANQAELKQIIVAGNTIDVIPGVYEYPVYDLELPEIGTIEAIATDSQALVNIYTKEHPEGIGEEYEIAIVYDVNFEEAIIVQITVMSPNGKNQNTYKLYFQDVSDDSSLQEVSYNVTGDDEDKVIVEMTQSSDPNYAGEYIIELGPDLENVNIEMIATEEISTINVEELIGNPLEVSKNISSMTEDIEIHVVVTAESGRQSMYKIIIKKTTGIIGKVITENYQHNYENVPVQILDSTDTEIATAVTEADGTFEVKVPVGEGYKVVIKKPGYLTYTITDIPVAYGVRTYVGIANLIAGEVAGNDEYIELRDLVQVNKRARVKTSVDDTNMLYDLNEDGVIDSKDLSIVTKNYDKTVEKNSTFKYERVVNVKGFVIDQTGELLPNAIIELGNRALTSEAGEFDLADVKMGEYTLIVKDSDGNIIGQNKISIVEGSEYSISESIITVKPNTYVVDLQVIVSGTRAVISKRGEEPDEDVIFPTVTINEVEITDNSIRVTVTGEDKNLASFQLLKDGEVIASEEVSGVEVYETTLEGTIVTEFNTTHNLIVVVEDTLGHRTEKALTEPDNTIRTVEDLVKFSTLVDGRKSYTGETVKLSNDLDLSEVDFAPIGSSAAKVFKGTFDGNGHTISNININSTKANVGLFGYVQNATIKNVGIESGNITSTLSQVAGIVGKAMGNTTIENCYNKASISGTSYVGGIVGDATGTTTIITIENCYNTGAVTGDTNIGGIVGIINAGTIENCYNIGEVTGTETGNVGEIIGYKKASGEGNNIVTASVVNCYYLNTERQGIGKIDEVTTDIEITDTTEAITDNETLLDNLGDGYVSDEYSLNNEYPILKWQVEAIEPKMMKGRRLRRKEDEEDDEDEMILPIQTEYIITSDFDVREHPVTGKADVMHYGIDIAADWQSEVLAIADGIVTFAGENGGYGYCIEIEHTINGEKVYSFYAHLYEIDVAVGDTIEQGQTIGKVGGMPGTPGAGTSTGPHLHLEIRKQSGSYSSAVDPKDYLEF